MILRVCLSVMSIYC